MASYNKVFLMGNLTRDPAVKFLPSQTQVAEFGLAVNRKYTTAAGEAKEEVAFVDCTAFGRQAETISQYCTKGKPLFIEGRLKFDTWDDKQSGGKRSKLTVVVENFQFLSGRDGGERDDDSAPASDRPARQSGGQKMFPPSEERRTWDANPHSGAAKNFAKAVGLGARGKATQAEPPFGDEQHFQDADIPFRWEGRRGDAI